MNHVLTLLTGLEAKRRAHPDEEWEVKNWDKHTLRPWEAVSESLVRWGEKAKELTIYVLLKKFSTGGVFWTTEMKTLCKDFREERKTSSDNVIMDVRLHVKFDEMQKEQRGKSKLPESAANAQFPLAAEMKAILEQRLDGKSPMWDEGVCARGKYELLEVKTGLGDDYETATNILDYKVDELFGGKSEVTKGEWTKLKFAPFENGEYDITPEVFDEIWKMANLGDVDVPEDAKLTVADVKDFRSKMIDEKSKLTKLFGGKTEITKKNWRSTNFQGIKLGEYALDEINFDEIYAKVHHCAETSDIPKQPADAKLTVANVMDLANKES